MCENNLHFKVQLMINISVAWNHPWHHKHNNPNKFVKQWAMFCCENQSLLRTMQVTCIGTSAECKHPTVEHVLRIETLTGFSLSSAAWSTLIFNLSLPFWSGFVYQLTLYFYWKSLCTLTSVYSEKDVLLCSTCLVRISRHTWHCFVWDTTGRLSPVMTIRGLSLC